MLSAIKRDIFAYHLMNPPDENRHCDITLTLTNSKGRVNLTKKDHVI